MRRHCVADEDTDHNPWEGGRGRGREGGEGGGKGGGREDRVGRLTNNCECVSLLVVSLSTSQVRRRKTSIVYKYTR